MKKKLALLLALTLLAASLGGCTQESVTYPEAGQAQSQTVIQQNDLLTVTDPPTATPASEETADEDIDFDDYDPSSEEDDALNYYYALGAYNDAGEAIYAGATPIPLDPIDMPTPTPRPALAFTYATYTPSRLGLTFEAPNDWYISQDDTSGFTLTDPTARDNINASISITVTQVSNNYKLSDVKTDLKNQLAEIQKSYTKWSVANAASRSLLGADGYYNTYRGELYDGTIVRGLINIALLPGKTITVHLISPGWFNSSYTNVYTRLRNTLKEL